MIPIAKLCIGDEEKRAVVEVLDSGMLAQGKKVAEFEQKFAEFIGVKHAIATSNGTTALHAALLVHNIKEGDEVITSPFSFVATANTIRMTGAVPVFVDINENTFNIDPHLIEKSITSKTKAIMPVHLFGLPAEMDKIQAIAQKHNLFIIEDACQTHGAEFRGKKAGSFGTGCFSFYATKNMTTGEGGMITTNDDKIAKKIRKLINHGSEKKYYHDVIGYNYRMTDIAAAIGVAQLQKLNNFNYQRRQNAKYLQERLSGVKGLILPPEHPGHVYHQFTIRITPEFGKKREEVIANLTEKGIGSAIFYPVPIHQQKAYQEFRQHQFPVAEKVAQEVLSLPVYPALTELELRTIVKEIKNIIPFSKATLRSNLKEQRSHLSPEEIQMHSKIIAKRLYSFPTFQNASTILFYYPYENEVNLRQAINYALQQNKRVVLPAVCDGSLLCRQIVNIDQDVQEGKYGIKEPRKSCPIVKREDLDLILVPGVAFDEQGNRIGQGKGYYDIFLRNLATLKVGIAFEFQIIDIINQELHDVPVDIIITEERIIKKCVD